MSRRYQLAVSFLLFAGTLYADDNALWREYGLVQKQTSAVGKLTVTTYRMKDLTGALGAWEWLRSANGRPCDLASFCTADGKQTVISEDNYVLAFNGAAPTKPQIASLLNSLPNKRDTSLPAILTFLPREGLVPDSARYVLGPASLSAFAPELASANAGFDQGAEAQVAEYKLDNTGSPVRLAIFDYPTPEMARFHAVNFKTLGNVHVKRSGVLVAIVFGPASDVQADTLLSRVQYEAKITWNETPPPSPIKPLYQLLRNIIYASVVLSALSLTAGLMYAAMRLYRRRYGTLEADEAMTTLHLTGD
jgi:hypothetical protein